MTTEQREAIEELKSLSPSEGAINTVLSMIKGKEKEIEMLKEDNKRLDKEAQKYFETSIIHSKQYNQQLEKKEQIIDLMALAILNYDDQLIISRYKNIDNVKNTFAKLAKEKGE